MREYSTPLTIELPATGNLTDDVVANARHHGETVAFSRRLDPGSVGAADDWTDVTSAEFHTEVVAVAKGLVAAGIEAGDCVALMSKTRYEWTLLDYAIWFAGAVTVPVYETSSAEQVEWILQDSGAVAVVAETPEHVGRVSQVRGSLDALHHVWSLTDNAVGILTRLGEEISDAELEARRTAAGPDDLATLIYTSGTTARPKGCMLTHGNFMVELGVAVEELNELFDTEGASTLLFLPLAHVFARIIQVGAVKSRTRLGHSADIKGLQADLQVFRPTFVLAVPRVFEKIFNTASQRATADGRGAIFDRAAETAIAWSRGLDKGKIPVSVRAQYAVFNRLVYRRLLDSLGGRCQYAVSGGAPLGERLAHFYRGIGLTVLEGYGLTESTAALTVNTPDAVKIGSVGRPIPGTAVRVAEDGELLFRGGQVFRGYWRNEQATAEAVEEGWLHTGDLGEVDDEGYVRITGRKKEILVTAGGKNVAPAVLEDRLRAHHLVDQCLVVGDGRPFISALVTLDPESVTAWAEAHGKSADLGALVDDPDLKAEIEAAVGDANKAVSRAESIRRFRILPGQWTEEGGQLTPSLKLKRHVVMREVRDEVADLYVPYRALSSSCTRLAERRIGNHLDQFVRNAIARALALLPFLARAGTPTRTRGSRAEGRPSGPSGRKGLSMDRRRILLVVAVLVAALGAVLVFLYVKGADTRAEARFDTVEVLKASAVINPGEKIEDAQAAGKLTIASVSQDQVLEGSQQSTEGLSGTVALTTVYPGEQIIAAKWGSSAGIQSSLQIPEGKMAISVNLTDPARVAGFVNPGSEVSVFLTGNDPESGKPFTQLLLDRVSVLGVGSTTPVSTTTTDETGASTTEQLPRTLLTLSLDQKQAQKVLFGASNGELAFGLLTDESAVSAQEPTTSETLFK